MFRSIVERNGTRAIDTGLFYCPKNVPITINDDIAYVQDPVDTTYLTGIWNFFDNTRDESGHELDGAEDATYVTDATYGDGCNGRVIRFSGATKTVKIADRTATSTSLKHMDFSGQFDIMIWFSNNSASANYNEGALFSKGSSSNKIQIETIHDSGAQYVKAQIGSSSNIITGSNVNTLNATTTDATGYHWVRLKRDGANLVTLSVDGTSEGTATVVGDVAATSTDLYIGGDYQGSSIGRALISQVRMYCGGFITDEEFLTLRGTYRQPNTIKFGGTVWKIDEKPTHKIAHCKGYAKLLHNIEVDPDDSTVTWTTTGGIYKNRYTAKDGFTIIEDLMKVFTGTTNGILVPDLGNNNISGSSYTYAEYTALGSLYSNIVSLTINGRVNSSFSIDGRKILRIEDQDIDYSGDTGGDFSPIIFKNGNIKVIDLGYDDSTLVTQLTAKAAVRVLKGIVTKAANQFQDYSANMKIFRLGSNTPLSNTSVDIIVVQNDGGTPTLTNVTQAFRETGTEPSGNTEYKVIQNAGYTEAVFGADAEHDSDSFTATYDYEPLGTNDYYHTGDNNTNVYGVVTKQIYLPQLTQSKNNTYTGTSLQNWVSRYLARFSSLNRRFRIQSPTLINHVRENFLVQVIDSFHGQDSIIRLMVKNVKYYYPEGITEINCGEHFLDSFDLNAAFGTALGEVRSILPSRSA
jgi:hypothetical protein